LRMMAFLRPEDIQDSRETIAVEYDRRIVACAGVQRIENCARL